MLSNGVTSLLFAAGIGAWLYARLMRNTGGNQKSSLTGAGVAAAGAFLVFFTVLGLIFGF